MDWQTVWDGGYKEQIKYWIGRMIAYCLLGDMRYMCGCVDVWMCGYYVLKGCSLLVCLFVCLYVMKGLIARECK